MLVCPKEIITCRFPGNYFTPVLHLVLKAIKRETKWLVRKRRIFLHLQAVRREKAASGPVGERILDPQLPLNEIVDVRIRPPEPLDAFSYGTERRSLKAYFGTANTKHATMKIGWKAKKLWSPCVTTHRERRCEVNLCLHMPGNSSSTLVG